MPTEITVDVRDRLDDAMLVMADADANRVSVVESGEVIGELTYRDALTTYRSMIDAGLQRVDHLPSSSLLMEFKVGIDAAVTGQSAPKLRVFRPKRWWFRFRTKEKA